MVSVVIPVYNAGEYLSEAVGSVLGQSYGNLEVLLIDDGSSDGSGAICHDFAKSDARVRVFGQENQGVSSARNLGLRAARGEHVAFLDADDWWDSGFLGRMVGALAEVDVPICQVVQYAGGEPCRCSSDAYGDLRPDVPPVDHLITCWQVIFAREVIGRHGLSFTLGRKTGEDQEFVYKYMLHCGTFGFVPEARYFYRRNPRSVMHTKSHVHFDAVDALLDVVEYARRNGTPDRAELYRRHLGCFNVLRTLEFAICTLLTAGEPPADVLRFLDSRGYVELISKGLESSERYRSLFYGLWLVSPGCALRLFSLRKAIGRILRRWGAL